MIDIDDELRATLAHHAADAPPAGAPLLGAVHARSRRHAVRRTASVLGAAATVAGITLATIPLVTGGHGGVSPPVQAAAPVGPPAAAVVPFRATFVPAGWYRQVWPSVVRGNGQLRLESPDPATWVTIQFAGVASPPPGSVEVARDIGTQRITVAGQGSVTRALLTRIARGVQLEPAQTPVRFPYRLAYLPPGLGLNTAMAALAHVGIAGDSAGSTGATQHYDPPAADSLAVFGKRPRPAGDGDTAVLSIRVAYNDGSTIARRKWGTPNTVFGGHRARLLSNGAGVVVFDAYAHEVVVFAIQRGAVSTSQLERVVRGFWALVDITAWDSWMPDPFPR